MNARIVAPRIFFGSKLAVATAMHPLPERRRGRHNLERGTRQARLVETAGVLVTDGRLDAGWAGDTLARRAGRRRGRHTPRAHETG